MTALTNALREDFLSEIARRASALKSYIDPAISVETLWAMTVAPGDLDVFPRIDRILGVDKTHRQYDVGKTYYVTTAGLDFTATASIIAMHQTPYAGPSVVYPDNDGGAVSAYISRVAVIEAQQHLLEIALRHVDNQCDSVVQLVSVLPFVREIAGHLAGCQTYKSHRATYDRVAKAKPPAAGIDYPVMSRELSALTRKAAGMWARWGLLLKEQQGRPKPKPDVYIEAKLTRRTSYLPD